ncbi:imidazoleglycerol-phosphate dehydratase HisB [Clostridium sp. cel8]|jgi:imidazoleglycerol-phosphate dehydratase|uniref:imidazoleglycerol-phosphate dehydratase HisB n=1 Tax=unclassified Clostridium TaxID=2614128 RepID=UPI0015F38BE5|nr:imidazoleglycerol-phosphate dehydratase HisB [Clostridium sp. cel8]MBA5850578.1 imidazoleglycerol-phosphate dehydratase HisB [Clostridium sp. cel8]
MDKDNERKASIKRSTSETNVSVELNIDGDGNYEIDTGIGFFDHMLTMIAKHGNIDLKIKAEGDLNVDFHHTVEDVGIVIGQCIKKALGDKKSIRRYGTFFLPMDESLEMASIDLSGRAYIVFDAELKSEKVGNMDTELIEEFFRAVAFNSDMTLHIKCLYGKNTHHIIEGMFKAFGHAFREAYSIDENIKGVLSTKGTI